MKALARQVNRWTHLANPIYYTPVAAVGTKVVQLCDGSFSYPRRRASLRFGGCFGQGLPWLTKPGGNACLLHAENPSHFRVSLKAKRYYHT